MVFSHQDRIIDELENKIAQLKILLEETIIKHSDAEYELKDLKHALENLSGDEIDNCSEKMLVMASEWEDCE